MKVRTCKACQAEYTTLGNSGPQGHCKTCTKSRTKARMDPYQKQRHAAKKTKYWKDHDTYLTRAKLYRMTHREKSMLGKARYRAFRDGIAFNLDESDIVIPQICPVLGIPIVLDAETLVDGSPTIDRVSPGLGYTKGNVRIVSWRANRLKSDSTPEEIEALYFDSQRQKIRRVS